MRAESGDRRQAPVWGQLSAARYPAGNEIAWERLRQRASRLNVAMPEFLTYFADLIEKETRHH